MGVRDTLNNNPAITTVGAVVIMVICLGLIVWQLTGSEGGGPTAVYWYDMNTGQIFVDEPQQSPIQTASGPTDDGEPAGVRATIFACGSCADYEGMTPDEVQQSGGKVAYLLRMPPQPKNQQQDQENPMAGMMGRMPKVSLPGKIQWVSQHSQSAQRIFQNMPQCSGDQDPEHCRP
jgi:hypothetical protein